MDTQNNTLGGGEILDYIGPSDSNPSYQYMDNALMTQFELLGVVKLIIILLLVVIMIIAIVKIFKIKLPFKGRAIVNELDHMEQVRKRDASILRANKFINDITTIVEHTPFALEKIRYDYLNYNLTRADIKIPGGYRVMKPQEYNALIKALQLFGVGIGLIFSILFSPMLGVIIIIMVAVLGGTLPLMMIRARVKEKDEEIIANFSDFYLMIHYVLMARANTPLSGIMKSYDKTTNSEEMHKFVEVCVYNIDTYGEYEGPMKIADRYKEIAIVGKLMRLIRQANEGADIASELKGFRQELIDAKQYALKRQGDKIIARAQASFNILVPILVQAIISAMAIYLSDLNLTGSLMG